MIFRNEESQLEVAQPENLEGKEKGKEVLRTIPKKIEGRKCYQKISNVSYYVYNYIYIYIDSTLTFNVFLFLLDKWHT